MTDYTPTHVPGHALTLTASAAVTGGQALEVTGDDQVGPAAAGTAKFVGHAGHDAAAGQRVTVHTPGRTVHEGTASAAIAAGDAVQVGEDAGLAPLGEDADTPARIGLALRGAGSGQTCRYQSA